MYNIFQRIAQTSWKLGQSYSGGTLTSIKVNPDDSVTLELDYGKKEVNLKYDETLEHWKSVHTPTFNISILDIDIRRLDFKLRTKHVLRRAGIHSMRELIRHSEMDLGRIENCGRVTLSDIKYLLSQYGLKLRAPERN